MKRILATLGVTGLALLGATAPATAGGDDGEDDHMVTICHATGSESNPYEEITVDWHAVKAHHSQHGDDIIPGNKKWGGLNWDDDGQAIYYNGCEPCPEPPVDHPEEPPVVTPEEPPVVTPEEPVVVVPPVVTPEAPPVVPPVVAPIGAVVAPPAAPAVVVRNPGLNVQTAVAPTGSVLAPWAGGLIVMLLAAAGVAARKVLQADGLPGDRKD